MFRQMVKVMLKNTEMWPCWINRLDSSATTKLFLSHCVWQKAQQAFDISSLLSFICSIQSCSLPLSHKDQLTCSLLPSESRQQTADRCTETKHALLTETEHTQTDSTAGQIRQAEDGRTANRAAAGKPSPPAKRIKHNLRSVLCIIQFEDTDSQDMNSNLSIYLIIYKLGMQIEFPGKNQANSFFAWTKSSI